MRWFDLVAMKLAMLFGRRNAAAQLDDELRFHLERQMAENRAAGMSPEEARQAALRAFGNPALLREQTRNMWSWHGIEQVLRDVRYGFRTLRRTPGFTAIAVIVIALGIGANVALFTVVRSVLLKPLPFLDPDRLVSLYQLETRADHATFPPFAASLDAASVRQWQDAAQGMAQFAVFSPWVDYNLSAEGGRLPQRVHAAWCSWNLFDTLGVQPAIGRSFTADDDHPGAARTVLLSYSFWRSRYAADAAIVGRTIRFDGSPYTVIGVLPASFVLSTAVGGEGGSNTQAWTPVYREVPPAQMESYTAHQFVALARLTHGTTMAQLLERLDAVQKQIAAAHPQPSVHNAVIGRSLLDDAVENYKTPLYMLFAATGCVLLIACLNVGGLLVARTAARAREVAIRAALGGGPLRMVRERIIESFLLAAMGGALGLLLALGALQWLVAARQDMNRVEAIHIDGVVIAFAAVAIVVCALFAGVMSAPGSFGAGILAGLQESSRTRSPGRARAGLRRALLVGEVGLTVVLLIAAGLLLKSFHRLSNAGLGVPVDNVLTMEISLPEARYKTPADRVALFEDLVQRIRSLHGVEAAGLVSLAPGEGWNDDREMGVVERGSAAIGKGTDLQLLYAGPEYFAAIGLPLLRGRFFTAEERLERNHVTLISQSAAQILFGGEDPIGKHLKNAERSGGDEYEIVGVVGDTRWSVAAPPQAAFYWPLYGSDTNEATIVLRARRDVESFAVPTQKILARLDSDLSASPVLTLRQAIGKSIISNRFSSVLVLAFAVIALVLASAGLYSVLTYLVAQRTGEIGIRMALGATRESVIRLVLIDGFWPAIVGLVAGLSASLILVRLIRNMLYETSPLDLSVLGAVAALQLAVAIVACFMPAWRASRLNPMQALRSE